MTNKLNKPTGYILLCHEHLQDGHEYWTKRFDTIEGAIAYMNQGTPLTCPHNIDYRMFELGREVSLDVEKVEEPQPAKVTTKWKTK